MTKLPRKPIVKNRCGLAGGKVATSLVSAGSTGGGAPAAPASSDARHAVKPKTIGLD